MKCKDFCFLESIENDNLSYKISEYFGRLFREENLTVKDIKEAIDLFRENNLLFDDSFIVKNDFVSIALIDVNGKLFHMAGTVNS